MDAHLPRGLCQENIKDASVDQDGYDGHAFGEYFHPEGPRVAEVQVLFPEPGTLLDLRAHLREALVKTFACINAFTTNYNGQNYTTTRCIWW